MSQSCVENYLHVIFGTKERKPLIPDEMENRLYAYMRGIANKRRTPIIELNGASDHIHLLLKLHPDVALGMMIKELKSYSTGWLKKNGFGNFGWQSGYGAFSCSTSHLHQVSKYILNQKQHHRVKTFQDEIESLIKKWDLQWQF
jgi:putative transposase